MSQGIEVVLATGKTRASATHVIARLGLTSPGVFLQGLAVYDGDGNIRHQQMLDPALAQKVGKFIEDNGFSLMLYSGTRILVRDHNRDSERLRAYHEPGVEAVGRDLEHYIDTLPVNKLHFFVDDP